MGNFNFFHFAVGLFVTITLNSVSGQTIKFGITQWGDVRSHMQLMQEDNLPEPCQSGGGQANCVGGIPMLMGYIKDTETKYFPSQGVTKMFRLATGNLVSGENGYLSALTDGWTAFGSMLNTIKSGNASTTAYHPDFMSLGIKEFESGLNITAAYYLKATGPNTTTVLTNSNCGSISGDYGFCSYISKTASLDVGEGVRVGVVGFVNPRANNLSDADPVIFDDPATAIATAVEVGGLASYIAVGTGTYEMAKSIIDKSSKVKLVIYGGGTLDLTGKYPIKYKESYIATTGSKFGTKLGALVVTMNGNQIANITGDLRNLDTKSGVVQDQTANSYLTDLRGTVDNIKEVGETRVDIDGASCWEKECNLGNLVTDAMVHCAYNYKKTSNVINSNTTGIISIWHGGAFLNDTVNAGGKIKTLDVHKWLPYHNNAYFVNINGKTLWKLFESSATGLKEDPNWGQFLQVSSGMEVTYNNKKISKIRTVHHNNGMPQMEEIKDDSIYNLVIPSIMAKGKSVFTYLPNELLQLKNNKKFLSLEFDDLCLTRYLERMGPVSTGFEQRISLEDESIRECNKKTGLTIFLTLLITALIIGSAFATWKFIIQPRRENGNCM